MGKEDMRMSTKREIKKMRGIAAGMLLFGGFSSGILSFAVEYGLKMAARKIEKLEKAKANKTPTPQTAAAPRNPGPSASPRSWPCAACGHSNRVDLYWTHHCRRCGCALRLKDCPARPADPA